MRSIRKLVVLLVLWLALGATVVSAAEDRPRMIAGPEVGRMARILGHFQAFLTAVWEKEAFDIDPFGRSLQDDDPADPGTDEAWEIDPLG